MSRKMLFGMFAAISFSVVGCPIDDDKDEDEDEEDEDTDSDTDDDDDSSDTDTDTDDDTDSGTCDEGSCEDCQECAFSDACAGAYDTCVGNQDCVDFANCASEATDQAAYEACIEAYPTGAQLYNDLVICVICEECYVTCDGAAAGC